MALGYTRYITSALAARRGASLPLMPLLHKANAPDDAVAQLSDRLKSICAMVPPILPLRQLWGADSRMLRSPFSIPHVCPRVLGSLCGGENNDTENQGNANRPEVETAYLRSKQTGEAYAYSVSIARGLLRLSNRLYVASNFVLTMAMRVGRKRKGK